MESKVVVASSLEMYEHRLAAALVQINAARLLAMTTVTIREPASLNQNETLTIVTTIIYEDRP